MKGSARKITNEELKQFIPLVDSFINKYVKKNWVESFGARGQERMLGNTGLTIADIRQQLLMEVCIALQNYDPNYTVAGKPVQPLTFVYRHLMFRVGGMMKRITKKSYGYGVWISQIEKELHELEDYQ